MGFPVEATATKKKKNQKHERIDSLNSVLDEIAELQNITRKMACKRLGIPTSGAKVTSKQLSGYMGMAKEKLRVLEKLKK